ncbi:hypothetical protein AcW1_000178 [Taiwanofungus camphoratus]|nr:hypothetical protein AcW2_001328 [Antrodia cinnamomea]KAI0935742.1 hypothetical protein AcV5_004075 [Antrodia cinnamomea]KAI0962962.1 hypothetical protein AcW1_000178 [Antrodia cinnamomea]
MIGPSIPAHIPSCSSSGAIDLELEEAGPSANTIGPQIPTGPLAQAPKLTDNDDEDEDEDDYAPALPPDMLAARTVGHASTKITPAKKVIGPTLPPSLPARHRGYNEEDDDDDYGPTPLPAGVVEEERDGVKEFLEKEERRRKEIEEASKPKALKREEWMLVPPSSSDLLGSIDPTKLTRPRQFARTSAPARNTDSSLWTETPAERQQRLADEVAGKRRRITEVDAVPVEEEAERKKRRKHEEEIRKEVEEHTRKIRGATLIDQHAHVVSATDKDKDEESPVIWDHSRDMALSGRLMDDKSRDKFIREARGLGDRFGSGKSGGFL